MLKMFPFLDQAKLATARIQDLNVDKFDELPFLGRSPAAYTNLRRWARDQRCRTLSQPDAENLLSAPTLHLRCRRAPNSAKETSTDSAAF
jgi:hypothetical protein